MNASVDSRGEKMLHVGEVQAMRIGSMFIVTSEIGMFINFLHILVPITLEV